MKLLVTIIAIAQSAPTNIWVEKANIAYKYSVANPEKFKEKIGAAEDAHFQSMFKFCGGAEGTISRHNLALCGAKASAFVYKISGMYS